MLQVAENSVKRSLFSVGGRGLPVSITGRIPAGLRPTGDAEPGLDRDCLRALGELIEASAEGRARFHLMAGDCGGAERGEGFARAGNPCSILEAATPARLTPRTRTGMRLSRVRAFDPLIRATTGGLDLLVCTADDGDIEPPESPALYRSLVEDACRLAAYLGRSRVTLLAAAPRETDRLQTIAASLDEDCGNTDIAVVEAAEALGDLSAGRADNGVYVAAPWIADILRSTAAALAGSERLIVDGVLESGGLRFPGGRTRMGGISASLLAGAELLTCLGLFDAGARLVNAWASTLEASIHAEDVSLTLPYARRVSNLEFTLAVADRLGERPRRLKIDQPTAQSRPARYAANLRLVR